MDVRIATPERIGGIARAECGSETAAGLLVGWVMSTSGAFVWAREPETVYLIEAPSPKRLATTLRHESMHVTLNRLEGTATSKTLDKLPWRLLDAIDGAGRMSVRSRLRRWFKRTAAISPAVDVKSAACGTCKPYTFLDRGTAGLRWIASAAWRWTCPECGSRVPWREAVVEILTGGDPREIPCGTCSMRDELAAEAAG